MKSNNTQLLHPQSSINTLHKNLLIIMKKNKFKKKIDPIIFTFHELNKTYGKKNTQKKNVSSTKEKTTEELQKEILALQEKMIHYFLQNKTYPKLNEALLYSFQPDIKKVLEKFPYTPYIIHYHDLMLEGYLITQKAMFEFDINKSSQKYFKTFIKDRVKNGISDFLRHFSGNKSRSPDHEYAKWEALSHYENQKETDLNNEEQTQNSSFMPSPILNPHQCVMKQAEYDLLITKMKQKLTTQEIDVLVLNFGLKFETYLPKEEFTFDIRTPPLTLEEISQKLGKSLITIKRWKKSALFKLKPSTNIEIQTDPKTGHIIKETEKTKKDKLKYIRLYDSKTGFLSHKTTFNTDESIICEEKYNTTNSHQIKIEKTFYDSQGLKTQTTTYDPRTEKPTQFLLYYGDGKIIKKIIYQYCPHTTGLLEKNIYQAFNLLKQKEQYNPENETLIKLTTYNNNQAIEKIVVYEYHLHQKVDYQYYLDGELKTRKAFQGPLKKRITYDPAGTIQHINNF